ncbi:unnamed protein product [Mytilus edulis]|uniref:Uncharacterized protein n=1 Tax=Mytilus edulis TaxID=6550 RepID=A0A8S3UAX6_MYTED|nr:unnamed protein product [Mytilus edulis]
MLAFVISLETNTHVVDVMTRSNTINYLEDGKEAEKQYREVLQSGVEKRYMIHTRFDANQERKSRLVKNLLIPPLKGKTNSNKAAELKCISDMNVSKKDDKDAITYSNDQRDTINNSPSALDITEDEKKKIHVPTNVNENHGATEKLRLCGLFSWLKECLRFITGPNKSLSTILDQIQELETTGRLTEDLITKAFTGEEEGTGFVKYRRHILQIMEKFDIIVKPDIADEESISSLDENGEIDKSKMPTAHYYVPCLIKSKAISNIVDSFKVDGQDFNRTS